MGWENFQIVMKTRPRVYMSQASCLIPEPNQMIFFLEIENVYKQRYSGAAVRPEWEMYEEQSFMVTGIEEAGLGIVSTRRILRGEIILQEKPLLLVESKIKENAYTWLDSYSNDGYFLSTTFN